MPHIAPETISPSAPANINSLLKIIPKSETEALLISALDQLQGENEHLRSWVIRLQAASILNEGHCNMLRFRLAAKEERAKKGGGRGKLLGDGLPRLLSGDDFFEKVVEFTEWQKAQEAKKEARVNAKAAWQDALRAWEEHKMVRKEEKDKMVTEYKEQVREWESQKAAAKRTKKPFKDPKPKRPELPKQAPKPRLKDFELETDTDDAEGGVDTGSEAGSGCDE
ncbi:hypothetical protein FA15DRAFT_603414 [Coprinopsis marcescibilis]|uniref:Uncharacterized protein n=1 Tax=Coprinopsis marcescibilis TaxID=230819 RepID=A0A5C3KEK9_COPMA|nr:hypothetical protein FA15DRAFT_603414 [Coprinopsis marcescibilis]